MEGTTFSPYGSVTSANGKVGSAELKSDPIQRLAEISAICNDAKVVYNAVRISLVPIVLQTAAQDIFLSG